MIEILLQMSWWKGLVRVIATYFWKNFVLNMLLNSQEKLAFHLAPWLLP